MTVKSTTKSISKNKVKSKSRTLAPLKVTGAQGAKAFKVVTWTTKKAKTYLKVNAKTGKVTVKKGTPKGTYKLRVRITAKGTNNYKAKTVTRNITIKVK